MKKILLSLALFAATVFQPVTAFAQVPKPVKQWTGETVEFALGGAMPGPHFRAGSAISLTEDLKGDVYLAGGTVNIDAVIDGDLIVAGGTVILNGEVTEDLRIVGGTLVLNGSIGQDVTAAGGTINFTSDSQVDGSVIAAGGNINYNGQITGNLLTRAGQASLAGLFGQNIRLGSGSFEVAPEASIGGDLVAQYEETSSVSAEAQIIGETQVEKTQYTERAERAKTRFGGLAKGFSVAGAITTLAMSLASGLVILLLFPKFSQKLAQSIIDQPFATMGWGFLKLVVTPIVLVLLLMSLIGMPLAGIVFLLYLLSFFVANWIASLAVGQRLAKEVEVKFMDNPYWQFTVGLVLIKLVGLIPFIGDLVKFALFLMGLGALFIWGKEQVVRKRK